MFLFGIDSKHRGTKSIVEKCEDCNKSNIQEVLVFQQYSHVFKIPFIPRGKETLVRCKKCGKRLREYAQTPQLLKVSEEIKNQYPTPWWTVLGFGITGLLIAFIIAVTNYEHRNDLPYLKHPKAGDVYDIDLYGGDYTRYLVDHTNGDTVFFLIHSGKVRYPRELRGLNLREDFIDEPVPVLKQELVKMYQNEEILKVYRKP